MKKNKNIGSIIRSILSSAKGSISSKRIMGIWIILVASGCIIYEVATSGISNILANIMDTYLITGASLLGVDSITSIWRNDDAPKKNDEDDDSSLTDE